MEKKGRKASRPRHVWWTDHELALAGEAARLQDADRAIGQDPVRGVEQVHRPRRRHVIHLAVHPDRKSKNKKLKTKRTNSFVTQHLPFCPSFLSGFTLGSYTRTCCACSAYVSMLTTALSCARMVTAPPHTVHVSDSLYFPSFWTSR
jgi:hypothetical protein